MYNPVEDAGGSAAAVQDFSALRTGSVELTRSAAVAMLQEVRRGVMTGEGPTTRGRRHFSRTLDADDSRMCEQILLAAGRRGEPVSREEAEILFEINEAAHDREDDGRFDDLFVKAIAHHVLAAAGRRVPSREIALSPETRLADWADRRDFETADREIAAWLEAHLRGKQRTGASLEALAVLLLGAGVAPAAMSLASVLDLIS